MSIIDSYYYLFYIFYRLFEAFDQTRWLTKVKATISVATLEVLMVFSCVNYWDVFNHQKSNTVFFSLEIVICIIIIIIILLIKWFVFISNDKWKSYVIEFDQWSKDKNLKGTKITIVITLFIFFNFVFSCILFSPYRY